MQQRGANLQRCKEVWMTRSHAENTVHASAAARKASSSRNIPSSLVDRTVCRCATRPCAAVLCDDDSFSAFSLYPCMFVHGENA